MRIGELARQSGFPTKTIRYYELEGLLPQPLRTSSSYRVFSPEHLERLHFISKAKRLGLSLAEIRSILRLHDRQEPTCAHVRALLSARLAQIDAALSDLQELRLELAGLLKGAGTLEDCRPSGANICGIVEDATAEIGDQALSWLQKPERAGTKQPRESPGKRRHL